MNKWQQIVCRTYAEGDYAWVADSLDWRKALSGCGDTLFTFLMIELSDKEDCLDHDTAMQRLQTAIEDLNQALTEVIRVGE